MSEQVNVGVDVAIKGLEAAMRNFERLTGTASLAQRAISVIGRGCEYAIGSGGYVSPEVYQRMAQAVETLKRHEGELTKNIQERKSAFESILTQYRNCARKLSASQNSAKDRTQFFPVQLPAGPLSLSMTRCWARCSECLKRRSAVSKPPLPE